MSASKTKTGRRKTNASSNAEDTWTMEVNVTGVCAFTENMRRVLMVDGTRGGVARSNSTFSIPPHVPYIRANYNDIDLDTDPDTLYPYTARINWRSQDTLLYTFNGMELILPKVEPPDSPNLQLDKLVKIVDIAGPNAAKIDNDCLDDKAPSGVSAFVNLPKADMRCDESYFEFDIVNEATGKKRRRRKVANVITVTLNLKEDGPAIAIREYDVEDESKYEYIRFKKGLAQPISIYIGNSAVDDLLQLSDVDDGYTHPDYHFEMLYRLSSSAGDDELFLPMIAGNFASLMARLSKADRHPEEVGYPRCVPAQFSSS
jgi:hypothetical protein